MGWQRRHGGDNFSRCSSSHSFEFRKCINYLKKLNEKLKKRNSKKHCVRSSPEREHSSVALCVWKGPTLLEVGQSLDLKIHQFQIRGHFCLLLYKLHHEKSKENKHIE